MRCLGCLIRYADIMRAGLLALLWLAVANAAMADDAALIADSPMQARNEEQPPALSEEMKRLLDGLLKIRHSDTLMFDQRGIEETLNIGMENHKESKGYITLDLHGLPQHLSGKYTMTVPFGDSLRTGLMIYLDTHRVCAHLPQVLDYIGKPYVRRFILPSAGGEAPSQPTPAWPGVKTGLWAIYHFVGDNPAAIKPHLALIIQGIDCVRILKLESLLIRPEERR